VTFIYQRVSNYLTITPVYLKSWFWLWLPFILLSSVPSVLAGRWVDVPSIVLLGVLGIGLGCLEVKGFALRGLLTAFLCLTVVLGIMVQLIAPHVWLNPERSSLQSFLGSLVEDQISATSSRTWRAPDTTETVTLSFEAKLVSGQLGWQWYMSSGGFALEPLSEEGKSFTRVSTPDSNDPYLMQTFTLNEPIAGRTFRVELDMRSSGTLLTSSQSCQGVWLQVWYEGGEASCSPVTLTPQWQTFSHTWTAPLTTSSKVMRVILNDFDGSTYDVTYPKVYERRGNSWQEVRWPLPAFPALTTSWEQSETESGHGLEVSKEWQPFTFDFTKQTTSEHFTSTLTVPTQTTLAIRNVRLNIPSPALAEAVRQSYWFGHPNLAGHVFAVVALIAVALTSSFTAQVFIAAVGAATCYFTGSRTAWLVLLVGMAVLFWLKQPKKRGYLVSLYSGAVITLALFWQFLGRLQITGVVNPSSRLDIWLTSLKVFHNHFWLGIGASTQTFADLWFSYNPKAVVPVVHSHNLVLEQLVNFGILGGVAILWLLICFLRIAWQRYGLIGVTVVLALLALNMADVSLFYTWVLVPFLLYLNAKE
jgi:hypothetical protein